MATTTVEDLAKELKRTPAALLEQLQAAGINKTSAEDKLTEKDKTKLLEYLQVAHGSDAGARKKITLTKRETTEIRQADSAGKTRTVQVEVRKKRVLVKRYDSAAPEAPVAKPAAPAEVAPANILDDAELAKREAEAKKRLAIHKALAEYKQRKLISQEEYSLKVNFLRQFPNKAVGEKEWAEILKIKKELEELEKKEKAQFDGDLKNIRRAQIMCFIVAAWIAYVIVWGDK